MADPDRLPYRDPTLPVDRRVEDLLDRMTLEEKVAQLGSVAPSTLFVDDEFDPDHAADLFADGTGELTRLCGEGDLLPERGPEPSTQPRPVGRDAARDPGDPP